MKSDWYDMITPKVALPIAYWVYPSLIPVPSQSPVMGNFQLNTVTDDFQGPPLVRNGGLNRHFLRGTRPLLHARWSRQRSGDRIDHRSREDTDRWRPTPQSNAVKALRERERSSQHIPFHIPNSLKLTLQTVEIKSLSMWFLNNKR